MKEYNRTTRKWEEKEKNSSLKKPKLCKGKRPHDFVLLIPRWIKHDHDLFKDEIEAYYKIESERNEMNKEFDKRLLSIGVIRNYCHSSQLRLYRCSVCGKEKYE